MKRLVYAVLVTMLLGSVAIAGDDLKYMRGDMKAVLKNVSAEVSKNFYDPQLKGLDWPALTEQARQKIDNAKSSNEMVQAIYELVEKLDDSHTLFMPPASAEYSEYGFSAKPFGDEIRVYDVEPKMAAAKAGIRPGDVILQMQGFDAERRTFRRLSIYTMEIYGVSPLELTIRHPNQQIESISLVPKLIRTSKVIDRYNRYGDIWRMVTDSQTYGQKHYMFHTGMMDGKIGYIDLRSFPDGGEDFMHGLAENVAGESAVVIDLRDNGGGSRDTLLSFAGLFETADTEMGTWETRKKTEPLKIKASKFKLNGPIVLLVDSTTASAAEMLARHLQRTKKATVIGDHTAGAVTGADVIDGEFGAKFVMTYGIYVGVARVRMADGEELEKKGVTPDVVCLPSQQDMESKRDPCLEKALDVARKARVVPSKQTAPQ